MLDKNSVFIHRLFRLPRGQQGVQGQLPNQHGVQGPRRLSATLPRERSMHILVNGHWEHQGLEESEEVVVGIPLGVVCEVSPKPLLAPLWQARRKEQGQLHEGTKAVCRSWRRMEWVGQRHLFSLLWWIWGDFNVSICSWCISNYLQWVPVKKWYKL